MDLFKLGKALSKIGLLSFKENTGNRNRLFLSLLSLGEEALAGTAEGLF